MSLIWNNYFLAIAIINYRNLCSFIQIPGIVQKLVLNVSDLICKVALNVFHSNDALEKFLCEVSTLMNLVNKSLPFCCGS